MSSPFPPGSWISHLFTFPFWIFIDRTEAWPVLERTAGSLLIRIYPPFRSAPSNYIPMPSIDPQRIPFLSSASVRFSQDSGIPTAVAIPSFHRDQDGKGAIKLVWDANSPLDDDHYPADSLRIDSSPGNDAEVESVSQLSISILREIRSITNQWWLLRSIDRFHGYSRAIFPCDPQGRPTDRPIFGTKARGLFGIERPCRVSDWTSVVDSALKSPSSNSVEQLLLDAYFHEAMDEIAFAVLNLTMSLEQSVEAAFRNSWPPSAGPYKRKRLLQGDGLLDHLSNDLKRRFQVSIRDALPKDFRIVQELWEARGNAAHGQPCAYWAQGKAKPVDGSDLRRFHSSASTIRGLLNNLASTRT